MRKFLKYLAPYWWQVIALFVGLSIQVWSSLQLPSVMAEIINNGIVGGDQNYIFAHGALMLGITLIGGVGMVIAGFFASRIGTGFSRDVRDDLFKHILSFSISEIDQYSTASLITRTTNDITQLQMALIMVLRMSCQAPLMAIGAIGSAIAVAPGMTWILGLTIACLIAIVAVMMVFVMPKFKIIQKLNDRLNLVTRENLTGLRVIRAFNNEKYEEKKFQRANDDVTKVNLFTSRIMSIMMPTVQLVLNATTLLIIWVGAQFIDARELAVGDMMAFMQYAMQVIMSFMFLTMAFIIVPRAVISWGRIREVLNTRPSIKPPKRARKSPTGVSGKLEFRNVTFSYKDAVEPVLYDVSFVATAGQTTAVIGSTGSGKSTLVNLVPRLYDVTAGAVLIDDVDVREYPQHGLMDKIGYVPQKANLFSGTVKSNIAFGMDEPDEDRIKQAAKIAQATGFIKKLDGGFNAHIARGGSNVSGGQRQRLSIARAIAKDPEIYIFDDSFSALDFKTDLALREALKPVTKNATSLIIAQRVGTIKHADQIIVLDRGRIVGKGTHYVLLAQCPIYYEIAASQLSDAELAEEMKIAQKYTKTQKGGK
jgi:ATP-binding cassette subfamily B protein